MFDDNTSVSKAGKYLALRSVSGIYCSKLEPKFLIKKKNTTTLEHNLNLFKPNGLAYPYQWDEPISKFRDLELLDVFPLNRTFY